MSELLLGDGAAVEHSGADERVHCGDPQPAVRRACREDHAAGSWSTSIRERDGQSLALPPETHDLPRQQKARAEHPGLLERALSELRATDAARKTRVVPDERARAGLPADRLFFDHQCAQTLRGCIHRSRQARRAGADDNDVEVGICVELRTHPMDAASSAFVGSTSASPSLEMTTGSADPVRPAFSSRRRPSSELLSWVTCGTPSASAGSAARGHATTSAPDEQMGLGPETAVRDHLMEDSAIVR